ncbi:MAG TPA: enoyl-CoA hydratase-related protein, partial [Dehalococcoidia bacterium]|nr:enoyl-CoA hydratase-related protein [Dehalococcoidia bacterium]
MTGYNYNSIKVEREGRILIATLNRPENLNAFGGDLHHEAEEFFGEVAHDQDVFAIIVTGAGRAFSAGGDVKGMKERADNPSSTITRSMLGPKRLIQNILEVPHPIITAVNGDAVGLGATVALFGDIVVMNQDARIADTHVKVGIVAGDGGAVIWPYLVGVNKAKEFLMRGNFIKGAGAERIGLVNYAVPADQVMPKARELAEELANGAPWAIRWTKSSVNKILRERLNLILDTSLAYEWLSFQTQDHREAATAFVEKRRPSFQGR